MSSIVLGNPAVMGLILSGIVWLLIHALAQVGYWLVSHRNASNSLVFDAASIVDTLAQTVVQSLEATLRPTLAKPGEALTPEGRAEMRRAALDGLKTALGNSGVPAARHALQLGEDWLMAKLEAAVGTQTQHASKPLVGTPELGHIPLPALRKLATMTPEEISVALKVA